MLFFYVFGWVGVFVIDGVFILFCVGDFVDVVMDSGRKVYVCKVIKRMRSFYWVWGEVFVVKLYDMIWILVLVLFWKIEIFVYGGIFLFGKFFVVFCCFC